MEIEYRAASRETVRGEEHSCERVACSHSTSRLASIRERLNELQPSRRTYRIVEKQARAVTGGAGRNHGRERHGLRSHPTCPGCRETRARSRNVGEASPADEAWGRADRGSRYPQGIDTPRSERTPRNTPTHPSMGARAGEWSSAAHGWREELASVLARDRLDVHGLPWTPVDRCGRLVEAAGVEPVDPPSCKSLQARDFWC